MRHRISIQASSATQNDTGEEILSWSELAEVWAAIEHKLGGSDEIEQAQRVTAHTSVIFVIRHRADMTEKMKILWDSKFWNIRSLLPDNHKDFLTIEAEHWIT